MAVRKNQAIETRYVAEWVAKQPRDAIWGQRVPLGNPGREERGFRPTPQQLRYVRPWRQEVDALGIFKDKLVLVEGKVNRFNPGIGQLLVYEDAIRWTPELMRYKDRPIEKVLVVPHVPDNLQRAADAREIRIEVYRPPWVEDYIESLQVYHTPEYRQMREERLRMREHFGLE